MLCEVGRAAPGPRLIDRLKSVIPVSAAKRFLANRAGNIGMTFIMTLLPMMAFVGMMTDMGRSYSVQNQIQGALDEASLTGGRVFDATGSMTQATSAAQMYFSKVLPKSLSAQLTSVKADSKGNVIMTAKTTVRTLFLGAVGIPKLNVQAQSKSLAVDTPPSGNAPMQLEVALVMDVTGSMNTPSKLPVAKQAALALINTLLPPNGKSNSNVRISIVPFSENVNAGVYADPATGNPTPPPGKFSCPQPQTQSNPAAKCTSTMGYDQNGVDSNGYDVHGYVAQGYNSQGYDHNGFDKNGFDKCGYDKHDLDHWGYNEWGQYNVKFDHTANQPNNWWTNCPYSGHGGDNNGNHNNNGAYPTYQNDMGYTSASNDNCSFNRQTGRDQHGYDQYGFDANGRDHEGYDHDGYDANGYDHNGHDHTGFDQSGHNCQGFDHTGYNTNGYDKHGCDHSGHDQWGNNRGVNPLSSGTACATYSTNPVTTTNIATTCTKPTYITTCMAERMASTGHAYDDASPSTSPFHAFLTSNSGNVNCPTPPSPITPLTNNVTTLTNAINALIPAGGTAGHIGTAWGWYTLSPKWTSFWQTNATAANAPAATGPGVKKVVIVLTDGQYNLHYSTGYNQVSEVGGGNQSGANAGNGSSATQALAVCSNIKAAGIDLFTIGLNLNNVPAALATLQACASTSNASFATHYYSVVNNTDSTTGLVATFQTIANQIAAATNTGNMALRLTQ